MKWGLKILVFNNPIEIITTRWKSSPHQPYQARGGGRLRGPDDQTQLLIRNLLSYDAQTWWLLVFILKTHSDQILAKLINQGVAAALLKSKHPKNVENEKLSSAWQLLKLNDSGHKKLILLKLKIRFPGVNSRNWWLVRFFRGKLWHHISKTRKATRLKFCIRNAFMCIMTHARFRVDVNFGFSIWASQMYYLCHDIFIFSQLWLTSHPRSTEMCFLWSEIWDRWIIRDLIFVTCQCRSLFPQRIC